MLRLSFKARQARARSILGSLKNLIASFNPLFGSPPMAQARNVVNECSAIKFQGGRIREWEHAPNALGRRYLPQRHRGEGSRGWHLYLKGASTCPKISSS